jgi:hypothetical protein
MVTDSLDCEGVVQFVTLVSYLQNPCVIMFFNGNHGSHLSSIFIFTRRCEVVYISPTVTMSTSTLLGYTGLYGELEHLKIKTRLINEKFASVMDEYVVICAVVVSKTSCKDGNHHILRGVIAPPQEFFFFNENHEAPNSYSLTS